MERAELRRLDAATASSQSWARRSCRTLARCAAEEKRIALFVDSFGWVHGAPELFV